MFLLKSTTSKPPSREFTAEECTEIENMEYVYVAEKEKPRTRERRGSRLRASLFGGRRKSVDVPTTTEGSDDGLNSPSQSAFDDEGASIHSRRRRTLRKMTSKSSLNSVSTASEGSQESKTKSLFSTQTLFRSPSQSQLLRPPLPKHNISGPFNFAHLTQMNPGDASRLRITQDMGEEWNRALHRESQSRPGTAQTCVPPHIRVDPAEATRQRSNSTRSLSPMQSFSDLRVPSTESLPNGPLSPPLRSSSKQCVRLVEPADHESDDEDNSLVAVPEEEEHSEDKVGYAVTTPDDCCFGQTSPEGEIVLGLSTENLTASEPTETEAGADVPEIQETPSTPELEKKAVFDDAVFKPQMLLSVRPRPLSQLSQLSDTLNGSFIVPPLAHGSRRRSKRISCRLSTHMKLNGSFALDDAAIDSWEEDIDWCYEHEAEADCNFDWDQDSPSNQESTDQSHPSLSPAPVLETAAFELPITKCELLEIPEEPKEEEPVLNEKRITGLFEDRLLLPPSPRFPPSSFEFPRARDSGFASDNAEDQSLLMRAGNTALRHRSITMSSSMPDLEAGRSYREELCRVAKQLEEHIAALNQELGGSPMNSPPMSPESRSSKRESIMISLGNRRRADSQTTCVTLCSDTDTFGQIEKHEIITPAGSAHNSFQFTKHRASSVTGAGYAVEGRSEKGLSFPAAAIPGVVELGPGDFDALCPEEAEFVHYI